jgi:DNA-binding PadR family transcriptional regulator
MRVRDALLALLARGPAHGYQLKLDYERVTANRAINVGQIYQTLERLQREGLIGRQDPDGSERRVLYHATEAGRAGALELLLDTSDPHSPGSSAAVAKVLLAAQVPDFDPMDVLDAQRAALMRTVQMTRRRMRGRDFDLIERLAIEANLAVSEAELRWFDLFEEEMKGSD